MSPALLALISNVLKEAGRTDQAAQVSKLFTAYLGHDRISVGLAEFNRNLAKARVIDAQNLEKITVHSGFGLKPQWPDLEEKTGSTSPTASSPSPRNSSPQASAAVIMPLTRRLTNESAVSMPRYRGLLAVLLLSVLSLSGCFKSDSPLISVFGSVTPIPEGRYTYVDTDKSTKSVIITHDGSVTKMISIKDDGSVHIDQLLMQELDNGYYIVMDSSNDYALIKVNPKTIVYFDASKYCNKLLDVARSAGKSISEYGVVRVDGSKCEFNDIDSIKGAFAALANSGTKLSNGTFLVDGLVIGGIYHRQ
ncbi:MAG: hypothetical protein WBX11_19175 [Thiobacillaceae bacterium]